MIQQYQKTKRKSIMKTLLEYSNELEDRLATLLRMNVLLFSTKATKYELQHSYLNGFECTADELGQRERCDVLFYSDPEQKLQPQPRTMYERVSNPIKYKQTNHDCTCCNDYMGSIGGILYIENGVVCSIFEGTVPHDECESAIAAVIKCAKDAGIGESLLLNKPSYGEVTCTYIENVNTHYYAITPTDYRSIGEDSIRAAINKITPRLEWILFGGRGDEALNGEKLKIHRELLIESANGASELIEAGELTRGESFVNQPKLLRNIVLAAMTTELSDEIYKLSVISTAYDKYGLDGIRTLGSKSPMMSLVNNLYDGDSKDAVIGIYEDMMRTYRVSSAPVTENQTNIALELIDELGLRKSLSRRHAVMADISPKDVLYIDSRARQYTTDPIAGVGLDPLREILKSRTVQKAKTPESTDDLETLTIHELLTMVPDIELLEVYSTADIVSNAVTLIAPVHPDAKPLTHWGNEFSWTYGGNAADVINERVSKAGGNKNALLSVSYMWHTYDDYDINVLMPDGHLVSWKSMFHKGERILEIDKNPSVEVATREPVEHLTFKTLEDGKYTFGVHNFDKREDSPDNPVSEVRIIVNGEERMYQLNRQLTNKQRVEICSIMVEGGVPVKATINKEFVKYNQLDRWNVTKEEFVPVGMVMTSPNHWVDASAKGVLHYMFMVKDMKYPGEPSGFFPEYLPRELHKCRKVMSQLSDLMRCAESEEQLTGFGFSESARNANKKTLLVRVTTDSETRKYNVSF